MIAFVNYVAEKIAPEFSERRRDTFAYQYTAPSPKTLRPRPNVIVRLCSIECNFPRAAGRPVDAAFPRRFCRAGRDLPAALQSGLRHRFCQLPCCPHPNWFVLRPEMRSCLRNTTLKGVFCRRCLRRSRRGDGRVGCLLAQRLRNPPTVGKPTALLFPGNFSMYIGIPLDHPRLPPLIADLEKSFSACTTRPNSPSPAAGTGVGTFLKNTFHVVFPQTKLRILAEHEPVRNAPARKLAKSVT